MVPLRSFIIIFVWMQVFVVKDYDICVCYAMCKRHLFIDKLKGEVKYYPGYVNRFYTLMNTN